MDASISANGQQLDSVNVREVYRRELQMKLAVLVGHVHDVELGSALPGEVEHASEESDGGVVDDRDRERRAPVLALLEDLVDRGRSRDGGDARGDASGRGE